MNKSFLLASVLTFGVSVSTLALAQNSPEQGVSVNSAIDNNAATPAGAMQTGPAASLSGVTGTAAPSVQDDGGQASAALPALPDNGITPGARPNTDYGTLEPGSATTTRDSLPSTTRNADTTETRVPLAGANSFTQAEAQRRIESQGYSQVSGLAKDDQSVWRGTAVKGDSQVDVAMDYRGNVTDSAR